LADNDIDALIFEPGFSTATQITSLSGRGVGMDVVRSNITALRGTVEVRSVPGQGTTVQVRLPLTLAIIDGFQVRVGHSVFVIPLEMVDECVEYLGTPAQHYTNLRGTVLPFIRLRQHFALQGPGSARPNIVVIQHGTQRFGLLVDELLGEAQAVIKPLSRIFRQARGISGSSILGNGKVALILDIAALHQQVLTTRRRETITFTTTAP
jgi:two-component system chemotaxis sensor kinase CheA